MAESKELTPEEVKALQVENKKMAGENTALLTEVDAQKKVITELNQALVEKEVEVQASAKYPVFKIGKASYELVISKFIHKFKGERIEVDQAVLAGNKDLLAELVAKGSGALKLKGGI